MEYVFYLFWAIIIFFVLIIYIQSESSYFFKKNNFLSSKNTYYSVKKSQDSEIKDAEKILNNETNQDTLCVLDLETTGFKPENSEIVEIFILKVKDNVIIDEFYSMFKPNGRITNSDIHGITNRKVRNSPTIKEANDEIINFLGNSTLVGHNLDNFDLKFLNYHLSKTLDNKTLDTLKISRKVLGDKVENHKLDTLAKYFGVNPPTHQARDDVMATFEIYKKLLSIQ